ncbi:MAG: hypothetical protein K6T91_08315 [Firmicutes bacterium]|nr:hypothetical protein [Bacillota bacterium]
MLKRKLLSILVVICMVFGVVGAPAFADPQDNQVQDTAVVSTQDTGQGPTADNSASNQNEGSGSGDAVSAGSNCPEPPSNGLQVETKENVDVNIGGKSSATSGDSNSLGTQAENSVTNTSDANASGDSHESWGGGSSDAIADNTASQTIGNSGDAYSRSGAAQSLNTMENNIATISPDTTVTVETLGNITDANIIINVVYNYLAAIVGSANAKTGSSDSTGLVANNSIDSTQSAQALADAPLIGGGGSYGGNAVAQNTGSNTIDNVGTAGAVTGDANATNTMTGNEILIAPIVNTIIALCGDIVNANVVIDIVYNFLGMISGMASATSGDSSAIGASVDNDINSYADAIAVGDAPLKAGGGAVSDGSAYALNHTNNTIINSGEGLSASGNATASNTMENNSVVIAPNITSVLELPDITDSDVWIKVIYNFCGSIEGSATAETGNANSLGLEASNSIDSSATAKAVGDAPLISSGTGYDGSQDGQAVATNNVDNSIINQGGALASTGDADATNVMNGNIVNLSPTIYAVVKVAEPIIEQGKVIIEVVYDIWALLTGSANATTGNATAVGSVSTNTIESDSGAKAYADISIFNPYGDASAMNETTNSVGNQGTGLAFSGNANAENNMSNANVSFTGTLLQTTLVDPSEDAMAISIGNRLSQDAVASTGNADATGSSSESDVRSSADASSVEGGNSHSSNKIKNSVLNFGAAIAMTGDALTRAGEPLPSGDDGSSDGDIRNDVEQGGGDSTSGSVAISDGILWPHKPKIIKTKYNAAGGYALYSGNPGDSGGANLSAAEAEDYTGSKAGAARQRQHAAAESSLWIWAIVAAMLAAWVGFTLKAKPWRYVVRK